MTRDTSSLGFKHRNAFLLLTAANHKTPKGEVAGYLTAILYLAPHTSGNGPTVCPHSTPACREMCLAGAGLSGLPRQLAAKQRRTSYFHNNRAGFLADLLTDVALLKMLAADEGLKPALRLNGTSDIMWEREGWDWSGLGVQRYDYTKIPLHHRRADPGYHLTYSYMGPDDAERAVGYLAAGLAARSSLAAGRRRRARPALPRPAWLAGAAEAEGAQASVSA